MEIEKPNNLASYLCTLSHLPPLFFYNTISLLYHSFLTNILIYVNIFLHKTLDNKTDSIYKSELYKTLVEKYLLPIMHGFDIIFEKLSSIFPGTSKATGTVLDYLDGDYDVSLLEAMEFITLELDPKTTNTITDYLGADWQENVIE